MLRDYWAPVMLACYGEEEDAAAATAAAAAAADAAARVAAAAAKGGEQVFKTQEEVNRYVAEDRRKTEAKFKAQQKAELQKQEKVYNELLSSKNLTEQERDSLRESLANVEAQLLTEKELLTKQKKQVEDQLNAKYAEMEKNAKGWEARYKETSIKRELQEAAVSNEAFNARQMVDLLRPKTELVEVLADGKPTGEYQVMVDVLVEVDGKPVTLKLSPAEALKKMKTDASYANLFKANSVSGVGGNSGAGSGGTGKVDLTTISQADYRKLRKEHPEMIFGR